MDNEKCAISIQSVSFWAPFECDSDILIALSTLHALTQASILSGKTSFAPEAQIRCCLFGIFIYVYVYDIYILMKIIIR